MSFGQKVAKPMKYQGKPKIEPGFRLTMPKTPKINHLFRSDYDYCRVPVTRQLSPLEVGEDDSKLEPKKLTKIQIHQYGRTKDCYGGF